MKHRRDEFNVHVWGSPSANELMVSPFSLVQDISNEASRYLRSLGYKARVDVPMPQYGAAGVGWLLVLLDNIPKMMPFLRIGVFIFKTLFDKYARRMITSTDDNSIDLQIVINYNSDAKGWMRSWNTDNSLGKLHTMLDASNALYDYLKKKYPSMRFGQSVSFSFRNGNASQSFHLSHDQAGLLNTARYKKICRQTSFEKYVDKSFYVTKKVFIKRVVGHFPDKPSVYYFLLPSILITELQSRYQLLKYKMKERDSE